MGSPETVVISPSSVLLQLDQLLPLLSSGPYSASTLSMLTTLCTGLKAAGPLLDMNHKDKLDSLQTLLTKICQDSQLDLVLRLQVLEVIELRTLGWKSNEGVDNYYKERFTQFEESRRKEQERKKAKASSREGGDTKQRLSQTHSMKSTQELASEKHKSVVTVGGEKICISSTNAELTASAKKFLENHFSSQSLPLSSNIKYSRTDLLTLASSTLAREAPLNWDRLAKTIPSVIQRASSSNKVCVDDFDPSLNDKKPDGSKQKISGLQGNLPIIRNLGM